MGLPSKLKNMNAFGSGNSFLGVIAEYEEPKLVIKTEDFRGGGMLGDVEIDQGLEKLEASLTMGGHVLTLLRKFGVSKIDGERLRLVGAYQRDDGSRPDAVEIFLGGRLTEFDGGGSKAGDDTEHKYKYPCTYYRRVVNSRTEIEIDMLNGVFIVDGIDRYAGIMAALA
jgi:uncharacterized protein